MDNLVMNHQQHSPNSGSNAGGMQHHNKMNNNNGSNNMQSGNNGGNAQAHHHYSLFDDSYGNQWDNKQMYATGGSKNFIENESVLQVS
jgi:hypothetical protein